MAPALNGSCRRGGALALAFGAVVVVRKGIAPAMRRRRRRRTLRALILACLTSGALLAPAIASAHVGRVAADGCHGHRASGTCHCHREDAHRPGCTDEDSGRGDGAEAEGGSAAGTARAPAGNASRPPEGGRGSAGTAPAAAQGIRIAAWNLNLLHWRTGGALWRGAAARSDEDYRTLARYARVLNADIIAFQEVNGPRAAARVFSPRDYSLRLSGRYDPRYDDIYNGFAVRNGRFDEVEKRDYEALGLGSEGRYQHRWGVDLTVSRGGRRLRLLNVHLKSSCSRKSLRTPRSRPCRTLARQIEPLEAWIDARWREGVPFVVLGDFNREMDRHGPRDHLWNAIADGDPPGLELHRLSAGRNPPCWRGTSRHFRFPIDFFVFGARAWQRVDAGSFRQVVWADADADARRGLPSDHCPIAVDLF